MYRPAALVLGFAVLIGGCKMPSEKPPEKLEEFTSKEWKFKVKFPGKPEVKQQKAGTKQVQVQITMFMKTFDDESYMIGVADFPMQHEPSPIETQIALEASRDGAIANVKGTLESSKSVLLQGRYQGMEIIAKLPPDGPPDGQLRGRIYIVGKRQYQILVVGTATTIKNARANEFLESFQVTD